MKYPNRKTATDANASATSHFQWPCGPGKNSTSWYEIMMCVIGFTFNHDRMYAGACCIG